MKRTILALIFIICITLVAGCTPADQALVQTRSAQVVQTAAEQGKELAGTQISQASGTLVAEAKKAAATQAVFLKQTAVAGFATEVKKQVLASRTIYLDPGHGWMGDTGLSASNLVEKNVTLDIAFRTQALLQQMGYTVSMTRSSDMPDQPYTNAVARINESAPQIVISLHLYAENSLGVIACYAAGSASETNSQALAVSLTNAISVRLSTPDRGSYPVTDGNACTMDDQMLLQGIAPPVVILKLGAIDNPSDATLLETRQDDFALAIAEGVTRYFEGH